MSIERQGGRPSERRQFFRIDDSVQMSYRVVQQGDLQEQVGELGQHVDSSFTVMTRMQAIDRHLSAALHRIELRDPDVADYLRALDEKIELLGQSFLAEEAELLEQPAKPISLSAGGISFGTSESMEIGALLEVKLLLLPSFTGIITFGEVVGCDAGETDQDYAFLLRISFSSIRDSDRDALIRHILRLQSRMLRERRESRERAEG
jgi:hypothetical protein